MNKLLAVNRWRWYWRLPTKWTIFALTVLVVCFPYPNLLVRHVQHSRDPNALIEPHAPALEPLVAELRRSITDDLPPRETLRRIERYVYQQVPYEWDWNTWGTVDYLPTVAEVLEMGKEDCDGQAVVAASLMRRFGFETQLVHNFAHMWVRTDHGDAMSPGARTAIVATRDGLSIQPGAIGELMRGAAFGVAVFPLARELIILSVLWLLLIPTDAGAGRVLLGLLSLLAGLFLLRSSSRDYRAPVIWMQWSGVMCLAIALAVLWLWRSARRRPVEGGAHAESDSGV